jgi:predicted ABC-type ATPase
MTAVGLITDAPRVIIIAGPNGAGKTTFAEEFLVREAQCPIFVNADLIAAGIEPSAPATASVEAGRIMLRELENHFVARRSFAFESTLSGRVYVRAIHRWRGAGYRVKCLYLRLNNVEQAIRRVASRVRQGGHDIPEAVIRRRYTAGLENFMHLYAPLVDAWALYDNSGRVPILLDWSEKP